MDIPQWIKPGAYGAVAGGIIVAVVGFTWGGWVTGGSALASAQEAAEASRTELAAAICVQNFMADARVRNNLAELQDVSSSTQRRGYVEAGSWAVMPDREEIARTTAAQCANALAEIELTDLPVAEIAESGAEAAPSEPANAAAIPDAETTPAE